jgi:hypothetical protein
VPDARRIARAPARAEKNRTHAGHQVLLIRIVLSERAELARSAIEIALLDHGADDHHLRARGGGAVGAGRFRRLPVEFDRLIRFTRGL